MGFNHSGLNRSKLVVQTIDGHFLVSHLLKSYLGQQVQKTSPFSSIENSSLILEVIVLVLFSDIGKLKKNLLQALNVLI